MKIKFSEIKPLVLIAPNVSRDCVASDCVASDCQSLPGVADSGLWPGAEDTWVTVGGGVGCPEGVMN